MEDKFVNIAGYRFTAIDDRDEMRQHFRRICSDLELLGTILLSPEGINFFLSGKQQSIDGFIDFLEQDERFIDIPLKVSYSKERAFRKMYVRLKKEIISMGVEEIKPAEATGTYISPAEFKQWLDEERDITVLDTRNDYEIRLGTFSNAEHFGLSTFRGITQEIQHSKLDKEKPVVIFCTGGIRCEKASHLMINEGFADVRQLNGGILGYFDEVGADHWQGECFVFDRRIAVNPRLEETATVVCFACRSPLKPEEQQRNDYVIGKSCLYCIE